MSSTPRLIHIVSSNRWRGVERYVLDICEEFAQRGWRVTAYTRDAKAVDNNFIEAGIDLRCAPLRGPSDIASIRLLASHLREETPGAIVHTHRYKDALMALIARRLARRSDIKVVTTCHHVKRGRSSWLFGMAYRHLAAQIFVSKRAMDRFLSSWPAGLTPFDRGRLRVVHNSIRHDFGDPVEEPEKGPRIAMYHGRLSPGKGLETLIDAMAYMKGLRTRLWIVGTGNPDYVDSLRRRAIQRGVMDLIDWKRHTTEPYTLIRDCHFGVLPSIEPEAFGLANIEYMANGRPLVCTNNGAQPEYLTNGEEALLVTPASASELAEAMKRLATDDALRQRMGQRARARFERDLAWDNFADTMLKLYRSL